jgi:nicotinamidase-related amidase
MLANPGHSRIVPINPSRSEPGEVPAEIAARRRQSQMLLPAAQEIFGVGLSVSGEYEPAKLPEKFNDIATVLKADGLSLWSDQRFRGSLAASDVGVIFLGGAWLEEEVLIAALEGVKLGYDVRLLADLSIARLEGDRPLVVDRLALHGVLTTTARQTLLEWAVCLDDAVLKRRVQQLLA